MGITSSSPEPKKGSKQTAQKVETASKTGILSLNGHGLKEVPSKVFTISKMTTLDLGSNSIKALPGDMASCFPTLKTLKLDHNKLGQLPDLSSLRKLTTLTLDGNQLSQVGPLPPTITNLVISNNGVASLNGLADLVKLSVLDASSNQIDVLPAALMTVLVALVELVLDGNQLEVVPPEIGELKRLKTLSLRNNRISGETVAGMQPLPARLFVDTPLERLNLEGNPITRRQLNDFDGVDTWLDRRAKTKQKDLGLYMMD